MKFLALLILLTFLIGCDDGKVKPSINTALKVEELPAQESWNSKVFFTDSGKTKAVLYAGHLRMYTGAREP